MRVVNKGRHHRKSRPSDVIDELVTALYTPIGRRALSLWAAGVVVLTTAVVLLVQSIT